MENNQVMTALPRRVLPLSPVQQAKGFGTHHASKVLALSTKFIDLMDAIELMVKR